MPQQQKVSTENNFVAGLKTDFTALNFPENAATDTDNCVYDFEGDVLRRFGFDLEPGAETITIPSDDVGAVTSYVWKNAGGDGDTVVFVLQVGTTLYFYKATDMTTDPVHLLSTTRLSSTVDLSDFVVTAADVPECQYSDGNGYLFVYNPVLESFYCKFENDVITATQIDIKIRDFKGIPDDVGVGGIGDLKERPATLTDSHKYNLLNQGWTDGDTWSANTQDFQFGVGYLPLSWTGDGVRAWGLFASGTQNSMNIDSSGDTTWTVPSGLPAVPGQRLQFEYQVATTNYNIDAVEWQPGGENGTGTATVLSYSGTTLNVKVNSINPYVHDPRIEIGGPTGPFSINVKTADTVNTLETFFNQVGVYPSNTDVWFTFKEIETITTPYGSVAAEKFAPGHLINIVQQPVSQAPSGHFILAAFDMDKETASGITGLTSITTTKRPRTGAWHAGRVWFAGVDASQTATGNEPYYTWTENIYFSQIVEDSSGTQFGKCYQFDDPTDENAFNLLQTDGGVITIQGCGSIFKLMSIQNGLLVFAANGVWFITGSGGVGFNATDYTVTKISGTRSISGNSFVDVNGLPFFWNEEAIYAVEPDSKGSGLVVNPITVHSISNYYEDIPYQSKVNARGSYDPINYVVQWVFDRGEAPAAPEPPPDEGTEVPYRVMIFDDCCQLFVTDDLGETWFQSETMQSDNSPIFRDGTVVAGLDSTSYSRTNPSLWTDRATTGIGGPYGVDPTDWTTWYTNTESTDGDSWADLTMAINDGDYETFLVWDPEFFGSGTLIGKCNGISDDIEAGKDVITCFVDEIYDPQTMTPGSNGGPQWTFPITVDDVDEFYLDADGNEQTWPEYQLYRTGAQTANAEMILACIPLAGWSSDTTNTYPVRLSTDHGATWTNVTSIPAFGTGGGAVGAAFAAGGTIAYVATTDGVYKSTDSAATFSLLGGSPIMDIGVHEAQVNYRVRCSADGQVIFMGHDRGTGYVSTDGGANWSTKDFLSIVDGTDGVFVSGNADYSDYAMTPDGTVLVAGFSFRSIVGNHRTPFLCISNDSGSTWSVQSRSSLGLFSNPDVLPTYIGKTPATTPAVSIQCVAVAPDGQGIAVLYDYYPLYPGVTFQDQSYLYGFGQGTSNVLTQAPGVYIDVSTDQGATWNDGVNGVPFYRFPESGFFGAYVSMQMVGPLTRGAVETPEPEPDPDAATNVADTLVLNYNTLTKAWYPWSISRTTDDTPTVYDVKYLQNPGASVDSPDGIFKYVMSYTDGDNELFTFAENLDESWLDWDSIFDEGMEYESYFITGFKLHGQALRKWQPEYLQIYSRNEMDTAYNIQGVFGFGSVPNSGRWSNKQLVTIEDKTNFGMWTNKLRIRGSGLVLQLRVSSVDDNPFDIMGWSMMENQNANV